MITRESIRGSFPVKQLGDVADFLDNRRRPVKESDRKSGEYPYYGANGQQGTIDGYLFDEPLILLAEDGGFFDNPDRGIAYRIAGKTWVNNHAHVLRPKSDVDLSYLCRVLENYNVDPFISGSTRAKLTKGQAEKIEIPLPPLEEQKRIAAILDQADDIRRKRQHAIDRLNQLGQAIFHDMFGDPAMRTVSLGEVCQFQYGNSLPASIREGIGYDVYGSNGVVGSHNKGLTKGPTLVIGRKGSVGEINFSDSPCWPIDTTYYVDSSSTQQNLRWLYYALQNLKLQSLNKATGVPGLNRNDAYRLEIPLPPLEEQNLFADRVQEIDEFLGRMSETLSVNDALFTSLQHRAFAGEL
jgi:type I restriction enzyme S subunit